MRGYWLILADTYQTQRNPAERAATDRTFAGLERAAVAGDPTEYRQARDEVLETLDGFTAAPFTPAEQARRAAQLTRFLELLPTE